MIALDTVIAPCPSGYNCYTQMQIEHSLTPEVLGLWVAFALGILLFACLFVLAFGKAWAWTHEKAGPEVSQND